MQLRFNNIGCRELGTLCTEYSYTLTVHFQFQFSIIDEMRIDIYLNFKKNFFISSLNDIHPVYLKQDCKLNLSTACSSPSPHQHGVMHNPRFPHLPNSPFLPLSPSADSGSGAAATSPHMSCHYCSQDHSPVLHSASILEHQISTQHPRSLDTHTRCTASCSP